MLVQSNLCKWLPKMSSVGGRLQEVRPQGVSLLGNLRMVISRLYALASLLWEPLTASFDCEVCVCCIDMANMLQRHIFEFPSRRGSADYVLSDRLWWLKTIENCKQSSLKVVVVSCKRWSLPKRFHLESFYLKTVGILEK